MTSGRGLLNFTVREQERGVERKDEGAVNFPFSKINTSTLVRRPAGSLNLDLILILLNAIPAVAARPKIKSKKNPIFNNRQSKILRGNDYVRKLPINQDTICNI